MHRTPDKWGPRIGVRVKYFFYAMNWGLPTVLRSPMRQIIMLPIDLCVRMLVERAYVLEDELKITCNGGKSKINMAHFRPCPYREPNR